jgi:proteasome accessory factor B
VLVCVRAAPSTLPGGSGPPGRGEGAVSAKVERLVNVTVALLETRKPLTFAELRARTGYYGQADPESARRMFERDKDDLRRLGVPVETRPVPLGAEDGYLVDRRAYELPDVDLTSEEVAALALAVRLTGEQGNLELAKLAARAPDPAETATDPGTRVAVAPPPVEAIADAVVARAPIRFAYRPVHGEVAARTVDPYAVVQRRGAWYLVGRDHDRDALRAFRLDRFEGPATVTGEGGGFEPPSDLDLAAVVAGPDAGEVVADLAVAPTARWTVQARGATDTGERAGDRSVLRLRLDPVRDLPWLLGLSTEVAVLRPAALRERAVAALTRLAEGAADGPATDGEAAS